jgi:hypothetical protein
MYNNNLAGWRHIKESLRPQFSLEKADMMDTGQLAGSSGTKLIGEHKLSA